MANSLFDYADYRAYLNEYFRSATTGIRSRFAEAIQVRSGYVTQICNGQADLSPEQADRASAFLGHDEEEALYFYFLVQYARAGSPSLRARLEGELNKAKRRRSNLKERFKVQKSISEADEAIFYSGWQYLAVFALVAVPAFQTKAAISERLGLSPAKTAEVLSRLEELGLVDQKGGRYAKGLSRTHLSKKSPFIARHHQNWRLRAMDSLEKAADDALHYSSVITVSEKDARKIRELIVQNLVEISDVIAPSKDEKLCSLCIDFFEV